MGLSSIDRDRPTHPSYPPHPFPIPIHQRTPKQHSYVFWRYQGGYARGVMGKEDHPLHCTLGVDVLTAAFTACAPDDAPAGGSGSGSGVGAAVAATNTDGPCPPSLSEACCYSSSSSSAGTTDGAGLGSSNGGGGAHSGVRPVAGEGGEGGKGAHTFVYLKASSVDLAAPGTHLPACSLKQLGLDKPPSTPAPLLAPPSALSQPLVAPPPMWV